jgi:DNA-binding NarL/FixJ family response regulator
MTQHVTKSANKESRAAEAQKSISLGSDLFSIDTDVLVLEDEPLVAALMRRYLGSYPKKSSLSTEKELKISVLESGFDLLTADLSNVKVAVVDLLLPQITGVDLIRDFRKRFPNMGIIAVSGMATDPMKRQLKELLRDEMKFLSKPLRKDEFYAAFECAMNFHTFSEKNPEQSRTTNPDLTQEGEGELWTVVRGPQINRTAIQVERRGLLRKKAAA